MAARLAMRLLFLVRWGYLVLSGRGMLRKSCRPAKSILLTQRRELSIRDSSKTFSNPPLLWASKFLLSFLLPRPESTSTYHYPSWRRRLRGRRTVTVGGC